MIEQRRLRDAYRETNNELRVFESKIGATIALLGVPAGGILDWFVYPEHLWEFSLIRLSASLIIGVCLLLHFAKLGRRFLRPLTFAWLTTVQVAICYMIFLTDGFGSTYYAGLNLAIVAMGILLPTSVAETTGLCILTILLYVASGFANSSVPPEPSTAFNNLFFSC